MRSSAVRDRDGGFALLIVLWALVLVAFLVARLAAAGRGEVQIASNLRGAAVEQARADGAVHEAAFHVLDRGAGHWLADGAQHELAGPGGRVEIRVVDESGKVNLNTAPVALLQALLRMVGADAVTAATVADAVVAWRQPPDNAAQAAAAAQPYLTAGLGVAPPGAPFRSVGELGEVLGVTPTLLAALRPHVTVFTTHGPDRTTVDPVVARALAAARTAGEGATDAAEESVLVLAVDATVMGTDGARAARHAVLRLDPRSENAPVRVLAWSQG